LPYLLPLMPGMYKPANHANGCLKLRHFVGHLS
jgi:hypothetical protein